MPTLPYPSPKSPLKVEPIAVPIPASKPLAVIPIQLPKTYAIVDALTGATVLDYDNFVSIGIKEQAKVSDFPTEQGAFVTYNVAQEPVKLDVRVTVAKTQARRSSFVASMEALLKAVTLVNIGTQDGSYNGFKLESVAYRHTTQGGVGIIIADLVFIEVISVAPQYTMAKVRNPGAASAKAGGNTSSVEDPVYQTGTSLGNIDAKDSALHDKLSKQAAKPGGTGVAAINAVAPPAPTAPTQTPAFTPYGGR